MDFTFPDSKRTVTLEGINFLTLSLLRGQYENSFPNKPVLGPDPMEEADYNSNDPVWQEKVKDYNTAKVNYAAAKVVWDNNVAKATWAGIKLYYTSCLTTVDEEAVNKVLKQTAPFMDLKQSIRDGYKELQVPFQEDLMDAYIYLWHVCVSNGSEQSLFGDAIMMGTGPTQEAVQSALFRFRGKI